MSTINSIIVICFATLVISTIIGGIGIAKENNGDNGIPYIISGIAIMFTICIISYVYLKTTIVVPIA